MDAEVAGPDGEVVWLVLMASSTAVVVTPPLGYVGTKWRGGESSWFCRGLGGGGSWS